MLNGHGQANPSAANQWIPTPPTTLGGMSIAREATDRVLALDDVQSALSGANNRLHTLIMGVREHADSIFGAIPDKSDGASVAPKLSGRLHGLRDSVQWTHSLVSALEAEFARLRDL